MLGVGEGRRRLGDPRFGWCCRGRMGRMGHWPCLCGKAMIVAGLCLSSVSRFNIWRRTISPTGSHVRTGEKIQNFCYGKTAWNIYMNVQHNKANGFRVM